MGNLLLKTMEKKQIFQKNKETNSKNTEVLIQQIKDIELKKEWKVLITGKIQNVKRCAPRGLP